MIVAFLGWFESDDAVFLAMEYVPLGDLSKYITTGDIKEYDAKQITRDILEALIIIHEEGFTHRDIKPQVRFPCGVFSSRVTFPQQDCRLGILNLIRMSLSCRKPQCGG